MRLIDRRLLKNRKARETSHQFGVKSRVDKKQTIQSIRLYVKAVPGCSFKSQSSWVIVLSLASSMSESVITWKVFERFDSFSTDCCVSSWDREGRRPLPLLWPWYWARCKPQGILYLSRNRINWLIPLHFASRSNVKEGVFKQRGVSNTINAAWGPFLRKKLCIWRRSIRSCTVFKSNWASCRYLFEREGYRSIPDWPWNWAE